MRHLRRLLPYLRRYRGRYAAGILLALAATGFAVLTPYFLQMGIDGLERGATMEFIRYLALALVAFAVVRSVLVFRGRYILVAVSRQIEYDLRNDLYRHLMRLPAGFFDRHSSGDLASRVINDIEAVRMLAGIGVMILTGTLLLFLLSLAAMFATDARLAALCLIPLVLVSLVTALSSPGIYRRSKAVQDRLADLSTLAQENFSGARVVRAFSQEEAEADRFARATAAYREANLSLARARGLAWGAMAFLIEAALLATLVVGGAGIIDGTFTKGQFVAFTAYQFMLIWPVIAIGWVIALFQRGAACLERLAGILDAPIDEDAAPSDGVPAVAGEIEVRGLTFRYTEDRPPALRDVSLRIARGERVAVVGRTGAGKSTLVHILLGLYRVPPGKVFLDGRDINDYPRHALRAAIGSVPQDTFLFSDGLRSNIAFGGQNGVTAEMVAHAADVSRISVDAAGFPDGLDQVIGERGITLSGGQKQRTAIARAVIRRPSILLLDDALSSVDVHTEREILERLDDVLRGRTCVIVTHRFSVVSKVDRILVMDDGLVVEQGTHDELMKRRGLYARLVERQRLEESLSEE